MAMTQIKPTSTVYYDWIDVAKGIGILFVIMGHTMFPLHSAIDVFHMPLFFVLAGITLHRVDFRVFLLKKIERIFVPYIFFALLSVPFALITNFNENIINYNGPLWFLQTLFCATILVYLVASSRHRIILGLLLTIIYSVCSTLWQIDVLPFHLDRAFRSAVFIFGGLLFSERIGEVSTSLKTWLSALLFVCCFGLFFGVYYVIYSPTGHFKTGQICDGNYLLFLLSAIFGSLAVVYVGKLLHRSATLKWLGKNSLVIMAVHFPFAQWWNSMIAKTEMYQMGGG